MKQKYFTHEQLIGRFFLSYFLYSKEKFGTQYTSTDRLGRLSTYNALMKLYRPMCEEKKRVLSVRVMEAFSVIQTLADALPKSEFKEAFILTWGGEVHANTIEVGLVVLSPFSALEYSF